jgi:hypothetical protein
MLFLAVVAVVDLLREVTSVVVVVVLATLQVGLLPQEPTP